MSGAKPLLPLHAFKAWKGKKTLPFTALNYCFHNQDGMCLLRGADRIVKHTAGLGP
jgi:hypothetical protein